MQSRHLALCALCISSISVLTHTYDQPKGITRFQSWPTGISYDSDCFYELQPQLYTDKVSILKKKFKISSKSFIIDLFGVELATQWWPFGYEGDVIQHDPLDAITLGAQAISPAIIQESLRIISTTKALEKQNENYDQLKADGQQFATLLHDSLCSKINRCRFVKGMALTGGLLIFGRHILNHLPAYAQQKTAALDAQLPAVVNNYAPGLNAVAKNICASATGVIDVTNIGDLAKQIADQKITPQDKEKLSKQLTASTWLGMGALGLYTYMWNKLQGIYISCGIRCYDLLLNSNQLTFSDKPAIKKQLLELKGKVAAFGFDTRYAKKFQELADKL